MAAALAMAVGLLTGGRLGGLFGRERILLAGIAGVVAASIACAAAVSPEQLIAARASQARASQAGGSQRAGAGILAS